MTHGSRSHRDRADRSKGHWFGEHSARMWTVIGGIAAVIGTMATVVGLLIPIWPLNAQNPTSIPSGLPSTSVPSTAETPAGSLDSPHGNQIGAYSLALSGGEYAPVGPTRPTLLQVLAATQNGQGTIQWRWTDQLGQFDSGTGDWLVKLPSGTTRPTFAACNSQTAPTQSVDAPQGNAFCIVEPAGIIAGVFVKSINPAAPGNVDLQITIWRYSSGGA